MVHGPPAEAPAAGPAVRARGLHKAYGGQTVVDRIALTIPRGRCFGLLGPNGAGKTTTLRMLLGFTPPDGGELEVLGLPVPRCAREMRARVGVVPQQDSLDPDFTVTENLYNFARYFGISRRALRPRVPELLAFAALEAKADARIDALSGGMRRRLALARALVNDPELLILDEPTTGLDPQARQLIWQRLRTLLNQGRTMILTTHYMEEAQRLCDELAIIDRGRILAGGAPDALISEHIEPHVLEVHGPGLAAWLAQEGERLAPRVERAGETAFCYAQDEAALLRSLSQRADLRFLHRPAGLEDVFIKLTGRDLRD
ncbi:ATP-binding cassette domain-containing protein [Ectothiorhodospiraceae bacterium 2226]|nr:ATP-binding cassette domain-containing protein [Ectothiorhodospiraceae bacterium 2226]